MPALEVFDTVVLKANRQLVGNVVRTRYSHNEPLQDLLIIAHVPIDNAALSEFVTTSVPPKNYVFVAFSDEAQGHSLVHEDDLILLDRDFNLGDVVKKEKGDMLGTVINVGESYVLQPTWFSVQAADGSPSAVPLSEMVDSSPHICTSDCPYGALPDIDHPLQKSLLHNIPGEELKRSPDVTEGDYIVHGDWLGVAEDVYRIVVVLLEDGSVVVVKEPDELYIPVSDFSKPLVSLPEFDHLARPDILVAQQGWSATIPPHDFLCGQTIITNQRNLRNGRWLRGQFDPSIKPQGYILDVRARSVDVRWLTCNAFIPQRTHSVDWPHPYLSLYDNINTFPKRSELRSNKQVFVYDHGRLPRTIESRLRYDEPKVSHQFVQSPKDIRVGDHVKFRDQTGAALKYQGVNCPGGIPHNKFDRIPSSTTFGFDVNQFKVIRSRQEATVIWQDGTSSIHPSTQLNKFTLFEPEIAPADLVVGREDMQQAPAAEAMDDPTELVTNFNEMKFFESPHDLLPKRVGIVQSVDHSERVAQIRWFVAPKVRLTHFGHMLNPYSRFGNLSEVVEDVSLYEIMTFPALTRGLRDLVVIPPASISTEQFDIVNELASFRPFSAGQTLLSQIGHHGAYDLLQWLQNTARAITQDIFSREKPFVDGSPKPHLNIDWIGEIIKVGLDGVLTIRVNDRDNCKDIRLEHDQIICLIDENSIHGLGLGHSSDVDGSDMGISTDISDALDTLSTISESVEYEGGERLDNDSGDENWEDANEEEEEEEDTEKEDVLMSDNDNEITSSISNNASLLPDQFGSSQLDGSATPNDAVKQADSMLSPWPSLLQVQALNNNAELNLEAHLAESEPLPFAVLDRTPPPDQFQDFKDNSAKNSSFLKRVAREHRILASSLPKGEIYVRTYENRLDLMRCLIIGPADTPYEHAPFLIDLHLGKNFPREPPTAHFHSWTSGLGRVNPNLYEEGKICLSLLGTWPGKAEQEGWSEKATILQLLVSLQGLVFVRQPFYNEAGFEDYVEDNSYKVEAQRYNEKAYVMARGFIKHAITTPVQALEDVLAWIYLPHHAQMGLLNTTILRSANLIKNSEKGESVDALVDGTGSSNDQTKVFLRPLSRGAIVMLRKTLQALESLMTTTNDAVMRDVT